jgi:dTDP-4-dehydrorhamnose 3,5-epimerase|tara:strand:+ start:54 stop:590 length:537 start_codon:yes stop_codon:yes gene_type:complete
LIIRPFSEEFDDIKVSEGVFFEDDRGFLKKTIFGDDLIRLMGEVNEVICSTSRKNVIRGMHFQVPPFGVNKFIKCISGEIIDVFIDLRSESKSFGRVGSMNLKQEDNYSLFIPEGFGHGYLALKDTSTVVYLQSKKFSKEHDFTINPFSIDFDWSVENSIISEKDKSGINFSEFNSIF